MHSILPGCIYMDSSDTMLSIVTQTTNMIAKVIISLALVAAAFGAPDSFEDIESRYQQPRPTYQQPQQTYQPQPQPPPQPQYQPPPQPQYQPARPTYDDSIELPAKYNFDWGVRDSDSGNNYQQTESRDGDLTEGSYSIHLPDGRIQTVTYKVVGDSGFLAEVSYEGEARYDAPQPTYQQPQPQPTYQQAQPQPQPTYQQPQPQPQPTYQQPQSQPQPTYQRPINPQYGF